MKRLTYKRSLDGFEDVGLRDGITVGDAICRLANYEDTGFEPEHISELLQAENDGRLVVLPCKVGDAVYWMHDGVITECYINRVQINRYGVFIHIKSKKDKVPHGAFNAKINIGKTVFLTHEEAEAALLGGKHGKENS